MKNFVSLVWVLVVLLGCRHKDSPTEAPATAATQDEKDREIDAWREQQIALKRIADEDLHVGMTKEEVEATRLGKRQDSAHLMTTKGCIFRWCYGSETFAPYLYPAMLYVYFEDGGRVSKWHRSSIAEGMEMRPPFTEEEARQVMEHRERLRKRLEAESKVSKSK